MINNNHIMKQNSLLNNRGVTLIELIVTVALSGFVIASIYMSFKAQQRASTSQQEVAAIQQNLRAAAHLMESEIRMAGYDPTESTGATITSATSTALTFTWDRDGDRSLTESGDNITYSLYTTADGIPSLGRKAPTLNQAVAEYIENIEFYYKMKDNSWTLAPGPLADIRQIRISLLAKARKESPSYTNNTIYTTASGAAATAPSPPVDGFIRRQIIMTVSCRNMGI